MELGIGLEEDVFETQAPVLLNPAAAFFSVEDRTMADLNGFSHRCGAALLRAGAGEGESTTNGVMDGRCAVLEAGESLNPVSYTHLDVYKRQTINRMNDLIEGVRITGKVLFEGADIYGDYELTDLRKRVGMVFQKPNPFPMSVYDLSLIHI